MKQITVVVLSSLSGCDDVAHAGNNSGWAARGGQARGMTTTNVTPLRPAPTHHELEASLEAYFNRQVRLRGGRAVKLAPTEKGVPDRLVLLPGGRVYLVELKAVDGRTSAAQDLWHLRAAQLGTRVQLLVGRAGVDKWLSVVAVQPGEGKATRPHRTRPQQ